MHADVDGLMPNFEDGGLRRESLTLDEHGIDTRWKLELNGNSTDLGEGVGERWLVVSNTLGNVDVPIWLVALHVDGLTGTEGTHDLISSRRLGRRGGRSRRLGRRGRLSRRFGRRGRLSRRFGRPRRGDRWGLCRRRDGDGYGQQKRGSNFTNRPHD